MPTYPDSILLEALLEAVDAPTAARTAVGLLQDEWLHDPFSAEVDGQAYPTPDVQTAVQRLAADERMPSDVYFRWGAHQVTLQLQRGRSSGRWSIRAWLLAGDSPDPERLLAGYLSRCRLMLRAAFDHDLLRSGRVERGAGGAEVLPWLPIVGGASYAVVTTRSRIAADYDSVDAFLAAGWSEIAERAEGIWLARAGDALGGVEYLHAAHAGQRELARHVRPRLARYSLVRVEPGEQALYLEPPLLQAVAYLEPERTFEFAAVLEPNQHVPGSDVDAVHRLVLERELPDHRPVTAVRVVFSDKASALREKRPLLDVGAEVHYYDRDGQLRRLTE